jgi:alpha-D-ribose 1-methylphosphonate 5-triphosphate synthase subunit PhnH
MITLSPVAATEQQTFRALLDCMALPGKVASLDWVPRDDGPWAAAVACLQALVDHEVDFAVLASDPRPQELLLRRTGSRTVPVSQARYLLADEANALDALRAASTGTIDYPEEGATVVVLCSRLEVGAGLPSAGKGRLGGAVLELSGPGIESTARLTVHGLPPGVFSLLAERNRAFPLGIDLVLASAEGAIACVPRTAAVHDVARE